MISPKVNTLVALQRGRDSPLVHLDNSTYDIVLEYAKQHPQKHVHFDGCCTRYPK
jgi:hypothetical protein